jgi:hypothetical protein
MRHAPGIWDLNRYDTEHCLGWRAGGEQRRTSCALRATGERDAPPHHARGSASGRAKPGHWSQPPVETFIRTGGTPSTPRPSFPRSTVLSTTPDAQRRAGRRPPDASSGPQPLPHGSAGI